MCYTTPTVRSPPEQCLVVPRGRPQLLPAPRHALHAVRAQRAAALRGGGRARLPPRLAGRQGGEEEREEDDGGHGVEGRVGGVVEVPPPQLAARHGASTAVLVGERGEFGGEKLLAGV